MRGVAGSDRQRSTQAAGCTARRARRSRGTRPLCQVKISPLKRLLGEDAGSGSSRSAAMPPTGWRSFRPFPASIWRARSTADHTTGPSGGGIDSTPRKPSARRPDRRASSPSGCAPDLLHHQQVVPTQHLAYLDQDATDQAHPNAAHARQVQPAPHSAVRDRPGQPGLLATARAPPGQADLRAMAHPVQAARPGVRTPRDGHPELSPGQSSRVLLVCSTQRGGVTR